MASRAMCPSRCAPTEQGLESCSVGAHPLPSLVEQLDVRVAVQQHAQQHSLDEAADADHRQEVGARRLRRAALLGAVDQQVCQLGLVEQAVQTLGQVVGQPVRGQCARCAELSHHGSAADLGDRQAFGLQHRVQRRPELLSYLGAAIVFEGVAGAAKDAFDVFGVFGTLLQHLGEPRDAE